MRGVERRYQDPRRSWVKQAGFVVLVVSGVVWLTAPIGDPEYWEDLGLLATSVAMGAAALAYPCRVAFFHVYKWTLHEDGRLETRALLRHRLETVTKLEHERPKDAHNYWAIERAGARFRLRLSHQSAEALADALRARDASTLIEGEYPSRAESWAALGAGHEEWLVTLFTTNALDACVRSSHREPVVDRSTQLQIGTAQRLSWPPKSRGFWLRDEEGHVVIHVVKDILRPTWRVLSAEGGEVGLIVHTQWRENWRWMLLANDPWKFVGRVLVDDREVAHIRDGSIVDTRTLMTVASVTAWGSPNSSGTWELHFADDVDGPLRNMALAWLSVAADLQYKTEGD